MANKAKIGGRGKEPQIHVLRKFVVRRADDDKFGAYCMTTGRLISLCDSEYEARKRAGKKGWSESQAYQGSSGGRPVPQGGW